ncbi:MAG: prefoldin subunit alpha [Candidatus Helarchaeota archaeon]
MSQMSRSPRDRLNLLVAASREYEAQANQVQLQIDMLNQTIAATRIAEETIEALENMQAGQEILLPLGNLAYIRAKIMDTTNVILNVGASIHLDKTIAEAKTSLEKRLENLSKTQVQLRQGLQQIVQQMEQIRNEIERLAMQIQQGQQQPPMVGG